MNRNVIVVLGVLLLVAVWFFVSPLFIDRATNGPALVVYVAKHPSPTEARHVTDGGYIKLGKLKGNVGNQNYQPGKRSQASPKEHLIAQRIADLNLTITGPP